MPRIDADDIFIIIVIIIVFFFFRFARENYLELITIALRFALRQQKMKCKEKKKTNSNSGDLVITLLGFVVIQLLYRVHIIHTHTCYWFLLLLLARDVRSYCDLTDDLSMWMLQKFRIKIAFVSKLLWNQCILQCVVLILVGCWSWFILIVHVWLLSLCKFLY